VPVPRRIVLGRTPNGSSKRAIWFWVIGLPLRNSGHGSPSRSAKAPPSFSEVMRSRVTTLAGKALKISRMAESS
jgi:hypothetical protein